MAHAIQCPYCIDAYTNSCMDEGMSLDHITEAVRVASAIRGGALELHPDFLFLVRAYHDLGCTAGQGST